MKPFNKDKNNIAIIFLFVLLIVACSKHKKTLSGTDKLPFLYQNAKLDSTRHQVYIRAFKKEQLLEIWAKDKADSSYILLESYPFCTTSGKLGPKRREGDLQIPEGVYTINHFNTKSRFYLSLGLNYPNKSDSLRSNFERLGNEIYIHGACATIGCIPITNSKIEEVFYLSKKAFDNGQHRVRVDIFPFRFNKNNKQIFKEYDEHSELWNELEAIQIDFEKEKKLRKVMINEKGAYLIYTQ